MKDRLAARWLVTRSSCGWRSICHSGNAGLGRKQSDLGNPKVSAGFKFRPWFLVFCVPNYNDFSHSDLPLKMRYEKRVLGSTDVAVALRHRPQGAILCFLVCMYVCMYIYIIIHYIVPLYSHDIPIMSSVLIYPIVYQMGYPMYFRV